LTPKRAIGVLLDGRNFWKLHGRWLVFVSLATFGTSIWTAIAARANDRWPGGGSLSGLTLGFFAAAIFVFEMALLVRKTKPFRTARWLGTAKAWMKAHIWLGLLTMPLVVLHSGGRLGSTLTTMLVLSFAMVIGSGIWGLAMQNILPRMMLAEVPSETVYSQIDNVGRQYAEQARRLVMAACGGTATDDPRSAEAVPALAGAARRVGLQVERSPQPRITNQRPIESPVIEQALQAELLPYLETGRVPQQRWATREGQAWYFDDLRLRVVPELRALVGQLEELCERRRQLNVQQRLHFWLHNWLWLHVPLSAALMMLLAAHVVFALMYG
jgi:hypothetical protein